LLPLGRRKNTAGLTVYQLGAKPAWSARPYLVRGHAPWMHCPFPMHRTSFRWTGFFALVTVPGVRSVPADDAGGSVSGMTRQAVHEVANSSKRALRAYAQGGLGSQHLALIGPFEDSHPRGRPRSFGPARDAAPTVRHRWSRAFPMAAAALGAFSVRPDHPDPLVTQAGHNCT
jgi:hypothetical protein